MTRGAAAAAALVLLGCRPRDTPADAAPHDPTAPIAADVELAYHDLTGAPRLAHGVAAVPVESRRVVAIEGPDGPGGAVWIGDVSAPSPGGWTARRASRRTFTRRAIAALPPGPGSRLTFPPPPPAVAPLEVGVVVYGTGWCAVCAEARAWLDARRIPYTARDVEADGDAAVAAAITCDAVGITADRVPVIDVAGRVVVGFDPARLATILGEPI